MSLGRASSVVGVLLLVQCNGLSLHNCGGHNESNAAPPKQNNLRKASPGIALSASIGSYPGTSSGVAGIVSVTTSGGFLKVAYTLTGLDASLTSGGLHIHSGSGADVCSDTSLPGAHYFDPAYTDPWTTTWTKSAGVTTATGSFAVGASGYDTLALNELHAVVVHGAAGARVGCGFLQYYGALTSSIGSFPGTSSGVTGTFTVSVYTPGVLEVSYALSGLASGETSGGLHIHSGSGPGVCSDATLPGGHYFNSASHTDPWTTTWSKAAGSTSASGTFIVGASGYDTLAENYLHAVVVHAEAGTKIGCGYLGTYSTISSALDASMGSYPGTTSGISGVVSVTVMNDGLIRLAYYLDGLSASETSGGLHIHAGVGENVCSDASLPGGHHFAAGTTDPWSTLWVKGVGSTVAIGSFQVGASGYDTLAENVNHAVVAHAQGGTKIGCGYAAAEQSLIASMGAFPGTSSGVAGTVKVTVSMGLLEVTYTLTGLPIGDTSGGLHIHSGYGTNVCSDATLPGGHYFASGYTDPWTTTWTKADSTTTASGSFIVPASGYDTLAENFLHAVVAHDGSGTKIGCGVLGASGLVASATGDPHLQNVHGQKFDLMQSGKHLLIQIPRAPSESTLLRVDAEAQRLGGQCADMYFQELNITGAWADAKQTGGFHYHAQDVDGKPAHWAWFGNVQLKVTHGRTQQGMKYLNFYVKNLVRTGYAIGGLLGDDDHTDAATPPDGCVQHVALLDAP